MSKGLFVAKFSDKDLWDDVGSALQFYQQNVYTDDNSANWRAPLLTNLNLFRLLVSEQMMEIVVNASPFIDFNQPNLIGPAVLMAKTKI